MARDGSRHFFEVNARIIHRDELNLQSAARKKLIYRLPTSRKKPVIINYDVAAVCHVIEKAF